MGTELKIYVAWQPIAGIDKIVCVTQCIEVYNIEAENIREARVRSGATGKLQVLVVQLVV